jgi:outer membrane protein assembly factor BamB
MTQWGYSESPLVDGDLLICTPGGNQGTLAALDKKTGKVQWRSTKLTHAATYASVVAAEIQGVHQYICNSYTESDGGFLSGVAAKDGKLLWTAPTFKGTKYAVSGTPLVVGNDVYVNIGENGGLCHLFAIDKKMKAKDRYSKEAQKSVRNNYGGVVLVGDHIYGHKEPNSWFCQDFKTGDMAWDENTKLECRTGSIIAAGNTLYLYSDSGETVLLKADPKGWLETGRFTIPERSAFPKKRQSSRASKVWSHPAIANGRLYLRDCELVFCYSIIDKK